MPSRYIDLHILQDLPASCLNRGQYDEPKTLEIGNTCRAAISSQCLKRTDRLEIEDLLDEPAARTRTIPPRVGTALRKAGWPDDLAAFAATQVARCATSEGLATDPQNGHRTLAMLYAPATGLIENLAALCQRHRPALEQGHAAAQTQAAARRTATHLPVAEVVAALTGRTATINLFGRFLAGSTDSHVAGAVQMAWAFTTHTADSQPDFFTAVEDWAEPGEHGSAHMNTAFLTAGIFYRYATVNLTELTHNLGGDQPRALALLGLFTETFLMALPSGKNTATAPHTVPDLVHYVVRDRRPVSYASAFHRPVQAAPGGGYLAPSRQALSEHAARLDRLIGTHRRTAHGHATADDTPVDHLGTHHHTFTDLITTLTKTAARPARTTP
ncbi:type I-E CRISPR-associated protein Cas7/Cse4/CasC [Streptomyces chrestomyceticus]|uniref:type I-E CRISPR-associated protein Cas7/Cse4/CasC n=1 Tax=Streptomyces chrestomyceticus TaxID=68185 RepID=UPI0033FD8D47